MGLLVALGLCARAESAPQKIFAISQVQPGGVAEVAGVPSDSVLFYDVTDIGNGGADVFNNSPLFSVWMGYELFEGEQNDMPEGLPTGNREEFSAITVNPANGTMYAVAFDSGAPSALDDVGDTQGDFDLYRIDYQMILNDFVTNSRAPGTVYGPKTLTITEDNEMFLETLGSPLFDGTVDGLAHDVPHPSLAPTVHLDGAFQKIGEPGRSQKPGASFFDYQLDFIDPATLALMDTPSELTPANDFHVRILDRVSTTTGSATPPPLFDDDQEGGYNGNTTQSWNSAIAGRFALDPANESEPAGWALVNSGDVLGVWVADSDGGGDDVAFFEIDLSGPAPTATRKPLGGATDGDFFRIDEDPSVDTATNDGETDYLFVDREGNLLVVESGFFDAPQVEPKVITVGIEDYDDASGRVAPEGFAASGETDGFDSTVPYTVSANLPISGDNDNDDQVTNSTRAAFDKGTGYLYIIDQDTGFFEDIYVFDPATGQIVYFEFSPFDIGLFNEGTQLIFTRGDINNDGLVDENDVTTLTDAIADPTQGGKFTSEVGQELYDLTGDMLLGQEDLDELMAIIGITPPEGITGDYNGDDVVNAADYVVWRNNEGLNFALTNERPDAATPGVPDQEDYDAWVVNFGMTAPMGSNSNVPEPTSAALVAMLVLLIGGFFRSRRR
jgi:hypothetical protein